MTTMYQYFHTTQWAIEGADWRPSTRPPTPDIFTLYDSSGVVVGSSVISTLTLTLYDPMSAGFPIINAVDELNIKNDGLRGTISPSGVFALKLTIEDMAISPAYATAIYERRNALVSWTATNNRAGALLFEFCLRNLVRRPAVVL